MIAIDTEVGSLPITDEDLRGLFRLNPLALEQVKGLVLERALVEARQALTDLRDDSNNDEGLKQEAQN